MWVVGDLAVTHRGEGDVDALVAFPELLAGDVRIVGVGEAGHEQERALVARAGDVVQRTHGVVADLVVETAGPLGGLSGNVSIGDETLNPLATFYKARVPTISGGT